jgi:hypothetical protein
MPIFDPQQRVTTMRRNSLATVAKDGLKLVYWLLGYSCILISMEPLSLIPCFLGVLCPPVDRFDMIDGALNAWLFE